jgi:hypothetical protein
MSINPARNYHCKDEELPVICEYASFGLKRDLPTFLGYSPKFNEGYVAAFDGKIAAVNELINPRTGTVELKNTTAHMRTTMDGLLDATNRLKGYIKLAAGNVPVSPADFGIIALHKKLYARDAEGVLHNLQLVSANIGKFKAPLAAEGLTDELAAQFSAALVSIAQDNQRQYEILSGRKALVQDNLGVFNTLGAQLAEICEVGKLLFKSSNPERAQEYTFAYLLKKVRVVHKKQNAEQNAGEGGVE